MTLRILQQFKMTPVLKTLLAGALILGCGWSAQAAENGSARRGLLGTWRVQVTLVDCATGAPMGMPFKSYLSFDGAGTLVETTSNPAFLPGQRSAGHGSWSRTGQQTYSAASEAFIEFDSAAHPPFPGFSAGSQRLGQTITVQPDDTFTSIAAIQFFDVSGNPGMSGCATATGTLFQ